MNSCRSIDAVWMGLTLLRIDSDCGVVKLHSSRDGCMAALNPSDAIRLAEELSDALHAAAASVERASRGGVR